MAIRTRISRSSYSCPFWSLISKIVSTIFQPLTAGLDVYKRQPAGGTEAAAGEKVEITYWDQNADTKLSLIHI